MEQRINDGMRAAGMLAGIALVIVLMAGLIAPCVALADEAEADGMVITLGEPVARGDGALVYEAPSYRLAESGDAVELDVPLTVTVSGAAQQQ